MSVYANEIEEANDHPIRRAHADALFAGTKMASLLGSPMAATDGSGAQQAPHAPSGKVVPLSAIGDTRQQAATRL